VQAGRKGADLLLQTLHQLAPTADRQAGHVVDGLVGVELDALAARVGQGVDDLGMDAQQAEFEDLEQAHRARADDEGVGLDHGRSRAIT